MNRPKKTPVRSSKLDAFHFYSAALKPVGLTYCEADQQEIAQKLGRHRRAIDDLCPRFDDLITTARSNKLAVRLGFQDFSQPTCDYSEKESSVIRNTVGNILSG